MISMRPVILFPLALTAAALAALGQSTDDKQATFFMGLNSTAPTTAMITAQ